jgi:hypothetical protein
VVLSNLASASPVRPPQLAASFTSCGIWVAQAQYRKLGDWWSLMIFGVVRLVFGQIYQRLTILVNTPSN